MYYIYFTPLIATGTAKKKSLCNFHYAPLEMMKSMLFSQAGPVEKKGLMGKKILYNKPGIYEIVEEDDGRAKILYKIEIDKLGVAYEKDV